MTAMRRDAKISVEGGPASWDYWKKKKMTPDARMGTTTRGGSQGKAVGKEETNVFYESIRVPLSLTQHPIVVVTGGEPTSQLYFASFFNEVLL
jgi:hypothetical protein